MLIGLVCLVPGVYTLRGHKGLGGFSQRPIYKQGVHRQKREVLVGNGVEALKNTRRGPYKSSQSIYIYVYIYIYINIISNLS